MTDFINRTNQEIIADLKHIGASYFTDILEVIKDSEYSKKYALNFFEKFSEIGLELEKEEEINKVNEFVTTLDQKNLKLIEFLASKLKK